MVYRAASVIDGRLPADKGDDALILAHNGLSGAFLGMGSGPHPFIRCNEAQSAWSQINDRAIAQTNGKYFYTFRSCPIFTLALASRQIMPDCQGVVKGPTTWCFVSKARDRTTKASRICALDSCQDVDTTNTHDHSQLISRDRPQSRVA